MKTLRKLFNAFVAVSLMVVSVAVLSSPVVAQVDLKAATRNLTFGLAVTSGVQPVASISIEALGFCLSSDGGTVSTLTVNARIAIVSHEELSVNCFHDIHVAFPGFLNCAASVKKRGSDVELSRASSGRVNVRTLSVKSQGAVNLNLPNPVGALKAIDRDGVDIVGGDSLSDLLITVSGCSLPVTASGVFVVNAEPSLQMTADFNTLGGCRAAIQPLSNEILRPRESKVARLDSTCVWRLNFNESTLSCTAIAYFYILGVDQPVRIVGSRSTAQTVTLAASVEGVFSGVTKIHTIVLQRGTRCSTNLNLVLSVTTPAEFADIPISFRIAPTNSNRVNDCTDITVSVTGRGGIRIFLTRRGTSSGIACTYALISPQFANPLQIANSGLLRQDIKFSAAGDAVSNVKYTVEQVPIQVYSVFPGSSSFATDDVVTYRISSPPTNCGSVRGTLGLIGAGVGVVRSFRALPGVVQLLGTSASVASGDPVYSLPPSLSVPGNFGAQSEVFCTVRITASNRPSECSLVSDAEQELTATSGTQNFDFYFIYSCNGITPATPVTSSTATTATTTAPATATTTPPTGTPTTPPTPGVSGSLQLSRGWNLIPYNGVSGRTPAAFLTNTLAGKAANVFEWDASGQNWKGYSAGNVNNLPTLTQGGAIFLYAPASALVTLTPPTLLSASGTETSTVLKPGLNMVVYRGNAQSVRAAFNTPNVTAVFRWSASAQNWDNYYRSRQVTSRPFVNINYGEVLFVYSVASFDMRVTY